MTVSPSDFEWKGGGLLVHAPTDTVFFRQDGEVDVSPVRWGSMGQRISVTDGELREIKKIATRIFEKTRETATH